MASGRLTPILQTYSILASTLAAGTNLATTVVTLPVLLPSSPSTLAAQWLKLFNTGITPVVFLAMSSALGFATLAYLTPASINGAGEAVNLRRNLYIGATVGVFGLAPYTQILMGSVNSELTRRAKAKDAGKDVHELVKRWGQLNFWRGSLVLLGAGLGVWASLSD